MSWRPSLEPVVESYRKDSIAVVIDARKRDIGTMAVRRLLPSSKVRGIGPFVYFDHAGPAPYDPARGDMPQHPHLHLATVTYMFEGAFHHRDSTGAEQIIRPGEINWMTAGRGVVHSERVEDLVRPGSPIHAIQVWLGLPTDTEDQMPSFQHYGAGSFQSVRGAGMETRVLVGRFGKITSPVRTHSSTVYCDITLAPGACIDIPNDYSERALYVAEGEVDIDGQTIAAGRMVVFRTDKCPRIQAQKATRAVLIGGEPLDGIRHIWWNFVSSRPARIEQAARDWADGTTKRVANDVQDSLRMPPMAFPWNRAANATPGDLRE